MSNIVEKIQKLKNRLNVTIVAHFYQKDEVFQLADITGDSLELAKKTIDNNSEFIVFCGVAFMGESVKVLNPNKRVVMPKTACCSMAKMIDGKYFDKSVEILKQSGITIENILPVTYINSSAEVKAKVGEMGGLVCTSSNAEKIISNSLKSGKKILFVPDRCLGQNVANKMGLKSEVINLNQGGNSKYLEADILCYDGFCSVHQLFTPEDIDFFREKYPDILVATHPECDQRLLQNLILSAQLLKLLSLLKNCHLNKKL